MKNKPLTFIAAQALILIQALFWLVFSIYAALGSLPGHLASGAGRWIMTILALGIAGLLASLVFYLHRRRRTAFYGNLVILALIAILSITDEVGLFDWISLITSLAALILLIFSGSWYFGSEGTKGEANGA